MRVTSGTWPDGWSGSAGFRREADLLLRRLLFAAYFFEVGLLLLVVPWSAFWDRNTLFEAVPAVHAVTRSAYVRGAVSGLGVLNLGAGLAEAFSAWIAHRRDASARATHVVIPPEGRS